MKNYKRAEHLRKFLSAMVLSSFLMNQIMLLPALAANVPPTVSNITGVAGTTVNGVTTFNIAPDDVAIGTWEPSNNRYGYKNYNVGGENGNFELKNGDIANFIMQHNGQPIDKFINLVGNQVKLYGLVNTVNSANGNFAPGHLIFVSPKGVVVGSSGVLNVGSFTAMVPDTFTFNAFNEESYYGDIDFWLDSCLNTSSNDDIEVNGKILARDTVELYGKNVTINNGQILAGIRGVNQTFNNNAAFNTLFENLVNTEGLTLSNDIEFRNDNGYISIASHDGQVNIQATDGDVKLINASKNEGSKSIGINSLNGGMNITADGGDVSIIGNGTMDIHNSVYSSNEIYDESLRIEGKNGHEVNIINRGGYYTNITNFQNIWGDDSNIQKSNLTINKTNIIGGYNPDGSISGDGGLWISNETSYYPSETDFTSKTSISADILTSGGIGINNNTKGALSISTESGWNSGSNIEISNRSGSGNLEINAGSGVDGNTGIVSGGHIKIYNNSTGDLNVSGKMVSDTALNLEGPTLLIPEGIIFKGELPEHQVIGRDAGLYIENANINSNDLNIENVNILASIVNIINRGSGNLNLSIDNGENNLNTVPQNNRRIESIGRSHIENFNSGDLNIQGVLATGGGIFEIYGETGTPYADSLSLDYVLDNSTSYLEFHGDYVDGTNYGFGADYFICLYTTIKNHSGTGSLNIGTEDVAADISSNGRAFISNEGTGDFILTADSYIRGADRLALENKGGKMEIAGTITNSNPFDTGAINRGTQIRNSGNILDITGVIDSAGRLDVQNNGSGMTNVTGQITTGGTATFSKYGDKTGNIGTIFDDEARVTSKWVSVGNHAQDGHLFIKGVLKATTGISISTNYNDVIIGSLTEGATTAPNIDAGGNATIRSYHGDIKNAGVNKTLIKAGGDIEMRAQGGQIGENEQACADGICVGIGANTARDLTKSINVEIDGLVSANTSRLNINDKDNHIINIASKEKDLNIKHIEAAGDVLLLAGEDSSTSASILNGEEKYGEKGGYKYYEVNIVGNRISLIASKNIGSSERSLSFNQGTRYNMNSKENLYTGKLQGDTDEYLSQQPGMDVLAVNDIYIKEGIFDTLETQSDAYGANVCKMIAREGSINAEFSGNTYIDEVLAEKDVNIVTRGREIMIDKLGGGDKAIDFVDWYGSENGINIDNATVKALDINTRTRLGDVQEVYIGQDPNSYAGMANSVAVIKNGRLSEKLEVVADDVYVNGVHVNLGENGTYKEEDTMFETKPLRNHNGTILSTREVFYRLSTSAVKSQDVDATMRDMYERNYYSFKSVIPIFPEPTPDPTPVPTPEPMPIPTPEPSVPIGPDYLYKDRTMQYTFQAIDKRQTMRFDVNANNIPISLENNAKISSVLDISRGGIAVTHNNTLNVGDVVPVRFTYGDIEVNAEVKIVSATKERAGAEFINLDEATANNILYINMLIEEAINNSKNYKHNKKVKINRTKLY